VISDIWRCDGREILPLMARSGKPIKIAPTCKSPSRPLRPQPPRRQPVQPAVAMLSS
jgi:hypothetical protein